MSDDIQFDASCISIYISEELTLNKQNINLMTYHHKNTRIVQLSKEDEYHLRQRNKIETLFSLLKDTYNLKLEVSQGFMHRYMLIRFVIKTSR